MEETLEVLWIEISISHIGKVLICSVYRPDQNADYHEKLLNNFERAANYNPNVLILGDFNINILNVNSNYCTDFMCSSLNLSQLVTEPTRVTTTSCTLIDHIYSSFSEAHRQTKVIKTCLSDHYLVNTNIASYVSYEHNIIQYRSFRNFNELNFKHDIKLWCNDLDFTGFNSIQEMWSVWKEGFSAICDKHAPSHKMRVKNINNHPWVDSSVMALMKERDKLHSEAVTKGDIQLYEKYKSLRNNVTSLTKVKKCEYIGNMFHGPNVDEGQVWKAVKVVNGSSKQNHISSDIRCNYMNKFFATIGRIIFNK